MARLMGRRIGWFILIWMASVLGLGVIALLLRGLMSWVGLRA